METIHQSFQINLATCEAVKFVLSAKQIGAHIIFHNFVQKLLFFIINIFAHYYLYLLSFQSLLQRNIYLSDEMAWDIIWWIDIKWNMVDRLQMAINDFAYCRKYYKENETAVMQ